jgi:hypothetical protein
VHEERLQDALVRIDSLEERLAIAEEQLASGHPSDLQQSARSVIGTSGGIVVDVEEIVQEAVAYGGPIVVYGRVRGPVVAFGGDVVVHQGAVVQGDAISFGGQVLVHEDGSVHGNRVAFGPTVSIPLLSSLASPAGVGKSLARRLVLLLTFAGGGVLMVSLFPNRIDSIARGLRERPLQAGMAGAIMTSVALLLALSLTLTLLGIPLALLVLGILALAWVLGFIGLCQAVGDTLPIRGVGARRWTAFLVGVIAIAFAGILPSLGQLLLVSLGLLGAGAALQTRIVR